MTTPAEAPVRPPRPTAVTVAFWLQIALVALLLLLLGLLVWQAVDWNAHIDRVAGMVPDADPADVADERAGNVVMSLVLGVPLVLLAIAILITAIGVGLGSNAARIGAFVIAGIQALVVVGPVCGSGLLIPFAILAGDPEELSEPDGYADSGGSKFLDTLYRDDQPLASDVAAPAAAVVLLIAFALTVAVVVLLASSTARRWFVPAPAAGPGLAGHPGPAGFMLPPGYMICPDPRAHGVPPHPGWGGWPAAGPEGGGTTAPAAGPGGWPAAGGTTPFPAGPGLPATGAGHDIAPQAPPAPGDGPPRADPPATGENQYN
ncbi:hypothetical protein AB0H57_10705 [Micromonospora sp. NPDC050686]|uniref:hypothetical protein n=1 Tax=Micromonospora sp. NPDC050686 TaxID=3154631 RepID=UPI00340080CE